MPKESLKDKLDGNELDLSLNNLEAVPVKELAAIPKATHLDLSCNLLVKLPDNFCSLTHLVKIDLSKNQLTELPSDFGRLDNLQHLDLLGNQLKTLPESFGQLKKLKWLDLKDNPLEEGLKKNAGDCLDEKQCIACAKRILLYMKEYSLQMEKRRQIKLQEQRDREAKEKARAEEEAKRLREEKKAEKERRKREQQAKRAQVDSTNHVPSEEQTKDKKEVKKEEKKKPKDKTGRGFCSCFCMIASILTLAIAVVVGIMIHCSTSVKDRICQIYVTPAQAQLWQLLDKAQQQATDLVTFLTSHSAYYFEIALAKTMELHEVLQDEAHKVYVFITEKWERAGAGPAESTEAGKT